MKQEDKKKLLHILDSANPLKGLQFIATRVPVGFNIGVDIKFKLLQLAKSSNDEIAVWARKAHTKLNPVEEKKAEQKDKKVELKSALQKLRDASIALDELETIFKTKNRKFLPFLLEYLKKASDNYHISFMVKNLGQTFPEESFISELKPFLKNKDERVVTNTIEGLSEIKSPKVVPLIIPFLSNSNNRIQAEAVKALKEHKPAETDKILSRMLQSENSKYILSAISAVESLKLKKFQPALIRMLNQPLYIEGAMRAIKAINPDYFQGMLKKALPQVKSVECQDKIKEFIGEKEADDEIPDLNLDLGIIDELEQGVQEIMDKSLKKEVPVAKTDPVAVIEPLKSTPEKEKPKKRKVRQKLGRSPRQLKKDVSDKKPELEVKESPPAIAAAPAPPIEATLPEEAGPAEGPPPEKTRPALKLRKDNGEIVPAQKAEIAKTIVMKKASLPAVKAEPAPADTAGEKTKQKKKPAKKEIKKVEEKTKESKAPAKKEVEKKKPQAKVAGASSIVEKIKSFITKIIKFCILIIILAGIGYIGYFYYLNPTSDAEEEEVVQRPPGTKKPRQREKSTRPKKSTGETGSKTSGKTRDVPALTDMGDFSKFMTMGNDYYEKGDFKKAVEFYDRANALNLKHVAAYNKLGLAFEKKGEELKAVEYFSRAITLNPNKPSAYKNRGKIYEKMGNYHAAIADYNKAIELNSKDADVFFYRGYAFEGRGEYEKAIKDYDRAIALNPKYSTLHIYKGLAYNNKGEYEKAIANYGKAIALNPEDAIAFNNRGNTYNLTKKYDNAIADFSKAIEIKADYALAYNNRGYVYEQKGEVQKAFLDYSKAIELNPDYIIAYYNRGFLNQKKGDAKKAIADFTKGIELDRANRESSTCNVCQNIFLHSINHNPKLVVHFSRGLLYMKLKDYKKAVEDFSRCIEFTPNEAKPYYQRHLALKKLKKPKEANKDRLKAIALGFKP
ncbi:tetratricopeptide repeat protein [Candidatus Riflebacteria bacterium]